MKSLPEIIAIYFCLVDFELKNEKMCKRSQLKINFVKYSDIIG